MKKIITRFPPSPTGELHIGNVRTMLFNYLFTRQNKGEIFMRFEDTDRERSSAEHEVAAKETLELLGITYDHGPFRQSERTALYREKLEQLIAEGKAYEGEKSQDGSGNKVIRFKNPNKTVTFKDVIRGEISIDSEQFEDFVIARSIDNPIYHFTVVVDDIDMGVSHVIRGEDHVTSTPRQILLMEALGADVPQYAHLPLIVGDDKKKLGKRHGAVTVSSFIEAGYLPSAIVNYLAFLGWNPGGEREIYSLPELVELFTLEKVGKNPATFNYEKLADINKQHMLLLDEDVYREKLIEFLPSEMHIKFKENDVVAKRIIHSIIKERISAFAQVRELVQEGEFDCFFEQAKIDLELMKFKEDPKEHMITLMKESRKKLDAISEDDWSAETTKGALWDWSGEVGRGSVLHPLRTLLSGKKQSPDPFTLAEVLGRDATIARIDALLALK